MIRFQIYMSGRFVGLLNRRGEVVAVAADNGHAEDRRCWVKERLQNMVESQLASMRLIPSDVINSPIWSRSATSIRNVFRNTDGVPKTPKNANWTYPTGYSIFVFLIRLKTTS